MGLLRMMEDFNWAEDRKGLDPAYVQVVERAHALLKADRLTAEKLARLADNDVELLREIGRRNTPLPGSFSERQGVKGLAAEAEILAIEADL